MRPVEVFHPGGSVLVFGIGNTEVVGRGGNDEINRFIGQGAHALEAVAVVKFEAGHRGKLVAHERENAKFGDAGKNVDGFS
jgi:hypothetical protein